MSNEYFLTRFKYDAKKEEIWQVLGSYIQKYIPEDKRVLDLGSGWCYFINHITAKHKFAIDINKSPLSNAKEDVNVILSDVSRLCFKDDSFDVVFASNILEHLQMSKLINTLRDCNRILKPKGRLIIISPNFKYSYKEYFDDYTHESILTDKSMKDLLNVAGFTVSKINPKFLPFSAESSLPAAKSLLKLYLLSPWKPLAGQMLIIADKK